MTDPGLSVVVSTLGNYGVLRRVLDGYARQTAAAGSFELIVVVDKADPSPEKVDEAIGERPYPVRRLTGPAPGLSANRNVGWRAARAPVVLLTDNDTIPVPRLLSEHHLWHGRNPEEEVAILGHVRWAPELEVTPFMRWLEHGIQFDYPSIDGVEASWAHLYGANSSIKRSFIERVGDWDQERLPYGMEDLDWAYRAREHGLRVLYNRRALVDHLRHDMTLDFWKRRIRRSATAERRFVAKHPELPPHLYTSFTSLPPSSPGTGRSTLMARFVPRWAPFIGPRVWWRADLYWRRQLAPHFLEAWEEAEPDAPAGPDLSERGDL